MTLTGQHVWISVGDDCWCKHCGVSNDESTSSDCRENVVQMDKAVMDATRDALNGMEASPKAIGQLYRIISKEMARKGRKR